MVFFLLPLKDAASALNKRGYKTGEPQEGNSDCTSQEKLNLTLISSGPGEKTGRLTETVTGFLFASLTNQGEVSFTLCVPASDSLNSHSGCLSPFIHLPSKMSNDDCRSPIGLDCCSCCLDLASGGEDSLSSSPSQVHGGLPASPTSPSVNHFRQLRNQLMYQNLNTDKLNNIMRQDSLESVVRDPCFLLNEGVCNSNIDQTMLSILLFFHSASGASVVAIDNKIEQAMDLVKNHLMYAVREEVEILKEQIKELAEKNNQLERENYLLKNLASPEQMEKFQSRIPTDVLSPLDNQNVQMSPEQQQQQQTCNHSTGSAV